jgi:hypothetical protein
MKKLLLLVCITLGLIKVQGQTLGQTMYIDFGPNTGTNGAITLSPDVNGHYWNNPTNGAVGSLTDIVNADNIATGYNMEITDSFVVNTTTNYGPSAPSSALLGDLAIGTATQDYFYLETGGSANATGQITFENLDPLKLYKFSIFGSRPTTNVRKTGFAITGLTTFTGELQTSDGSTGNLNTILTSTLLSPSASGSITVDVSILQNSFGYVNLIKVEEYTVTALDAPVADALQNFCSGNNPTVASLTATGATGSTLAWYDVPSGGSALVATAALTSGNYYVSQTVDGTESPRTTVNVSVNTTPTAPAITAQGAVTFCEGGNVILQSDAPNGTVTYQWYKDGIAITAATIQNYTATTAGSYTVSVTGAGNCSSPVSAAAVVTINALPTVAAITGNTDVAPGATSQLASETTGGIWSSADTTVATISESGEVTAVAAGSVTIAYTVTAGGCSAVANALITVTNGETIDQVMYIDFGTDTGTNGAITSNPDINGHYWNNPTSGVLGSTTAIINAQNGPTGFNMSVTDSFVVNTTTNYGPAAPSSALLGDLAIGTATEDYFYLETGGSVNPTGQLTFSNLDPSKGYKFYVFASRPTTTIRKTAFAFAGLNTFNGQVQTSNGTTGNLDTILETSMLTPNTAGEITVSVSIAQDVYGYINAMRVEEYNNLPVVDVTSITVTGEDIMVSGQSSQMTAAILPDDATFTSVSWSVDNTGVAVINEAGVVTPVSNGTVEVKATSAQNTAIFGTKTITVNNQLTALYLSGSATENGDSPATALPMHMVTGADGAVSSIFEIYTSLGETGTFGFYTAQNDGSPVYGAGTSAGTVAVGGTAIDPTPSGPVRITLDIATGTYTITPINWSVVGSTITNAWNGDEPLTYQGNGIWQATLDMNVVGTDTDARFVFKANQSWDYVMKKIRGTQNSVAFEAQANEFGIPVEDIGLTYGNFIITLNLSNYTYGIQCVAIDENKIAFMGSSVMNGFGATNMEGYAYKYNEILAQRATQGSSPFYRSNVSVNGNNTTAVLARYEKDLLGSCSKYVIYGLALGNEGIHETGLPAYNSYNTNMQLLIQMAAADGKVPVVMNNYVRGDYNATDYDYVKQMNLLMAQWDVPSVNMLGATDNGTGNWVEGYWYDTLHPNDAGHTELSYALVPSLFDALEAEKPQPVLATSNYITPDPASGGYLAFTPDAIIHPFTVSFDVQTSSAGNLMAFTTSGTATGSIAITADGFIQYTSPAGTITGTTVVNDGAWHKITLTHYYARGETLLYTDTNLTGNVAEQLEAKIFRLHGTGAPANVNYRNWFFYRSGMNELEIAAMNEDKMLKSSLELYAPLNGEADGDDRFTNLAQSTNTVDSTNFMAALGTGQFVALSKNMKAYPNPVKDTLTIETAQNLAIDAIEVYNPLGVLVGTAHNAGTINLSALPAGIYLVKVTAAKNINTIKIVKQ